MTKLNNVDMSVNAKNPEEENKMFDTINGIQVDVLSANEKEMVVLVERKELLELAIEIELSQDCVDMVVVMDYETLLSEIEWEIIQLLDLIEEEELTKEYEMEKSFELEVFESELIKDLEDSSKETKFDSSKVSNFIKEKFLEKLNPKIKERRKKRLKVYEEPIKEKAFPVLDKAIDVVEPLSKQVVKSFPMLDAVEDVVESKADDSTISMTEAQNLIRGKYRDMSLALGDKILTEVSYKNGLKAKMNYFYLNGIVVYSEPVNGKVVGHPNLNVPTFGMHPETYRTYVPYAYSTQELLDYAEKTKVGLVSPNNQNPLLNLLGENFGDMCFFESKYNNISSKELFARRCQKEAVKEGIYAKVEISMVPQDHRKNESFIQYGYGMFLYGELVFFDRVSRYGNTYDRTFMPNYVSLKRI